MQHILFRMGSENSAKQRLQMDIPGRKIAGSLFLNSLFSWSLIRSFWKSAIKIHFRSSSSSVEFAASLNPSVEKLNQLYGP